MVSAVFTGRVLFSTTIVCPLEYLAICLAEDSIHFKSLALPAPFPVFLVGVLTDINIICDYSITLGISEEKNKFLPLTLLIISLRPGS